MEHIKQRRKIIDSSVIPHARRCDRRYSYCGSREDTFDHCHIPHGKHIQTGFTNRFGFEFESGSMRARRASLQSFYGERKFGKGVICANMVQSKRLENLADDTNYENDWNDTGFETLLVKPAVRTSLHRETRYNNGDAIHVIKTNNFLSTEIPQQRKKIGPYKSSVIIGSDTSSIFTTNSDNGDIKRNKAESNESKQSKKVVYADDDSNETINSIEDDAGDGMIDRPVFDNRLTAFGLKLFDFIDDEDDDDEEDDEGGDDHNASNRHNEAYTHMNEKMDGSPRLLSVEEKWQIIFNEKTRAPIYAVNQYIEYLNQFVDGKTVTPAQSYKNDVTKKDGISHVTYLLRKLKLDLKMSYDSFLDEFLKDENKGLELLIKLLKSLQNTGSQQSGSTNMSQLKNYKKTLTDEHDCLQCIKFTLRMKSALLKLLEIPYGLETVSMGLLSTFTKSRGTAIEILTVTLSEPDGFSRTLECFTFLKLKIGEPVRFKSLMNMMNVDSQQNTIFKVACMKFLNSLLDCSPHYNYRVFLQHEAESAGLDVQQMTEKVSGLTGLEFDDLRYELDLWKRKYINVDDIIMNKTSPTQHQQHLIDELKLQIQVLSKEKSYLERQLSSVGAELKSRCEEIQRRNVPTRDVSVQCTSYKKETKSTGCQCSDFDDFGNPLKTAALYFGWQESAEKDVMTYYDYKINIEGQGQDEESETDHVIKVEDWLRTQCDSHDRDTHLESQVKGHPGHTKQYFRRQHSIRHKPNKTQFSGNWKLTPKPVDYYPSRFENRQCHTTDCDRCRLEKRHENVKLTNEAVIPSKPRDFSSSSNRIDIQQESHSSDSAIGGSGERLWSNKRQSVHHSREKSEEERLQDLITPDDSASACPAVEPFPDYSSVATRLDDNTNYDAEISEVLREFEGHLSRYDTLQEVI